MGDAIAADYVIVGGGSAGAVLANRLSQDPGVRVVLVEAGGPGRSLLVELPVGFARLVANRKFDWCYEQDADPSIDGRRFLWSAGKQLGGGSSINGQVHIRGTRRDYDQWAALGAEGWSYDDVLPYFIRAEHWTGPRGPNRGVQGPLWVSPMRDSHPACGKFLKACNETGMPTVADYNDGDMEGVFMTQAAQRGGWRCSTEKAYLRPIASRANLTIVAEAEVERIRFANGEAIGVTFLRDGVRTDVDAAREVVVSAGAMGSPALLMRSGIGSGAYLQSRDIEVLQDISGVGANLQEHPCVGQNRLVRVPTLNSKMGPMDMAGHMLRFAFGRKGPLSAPAVQAMALARSRAGLEEPDVQLHFLPLGYDIEHDTQSSVSAAMPKEPTVTIMTTLCHPASRGRVKLDERLRPHISHQFFEQRSDVDTMISGMKLVDRIFSSPAMGSIVSGDRTPKPVPVADEQWEDFVRAKATPSFHPIGTCRMGTGHDAVVDPQLRVRNVGRLRVADASVMPRLVSGNTNATAIMIGEKAADMILTGARQSHGCLSPAGAAGAGRRSPGPLRP